MELEQNAVVSEPKAESAGHIATQRVDVSRASAGKTQDAVEQAHRDVPVDAANIGGGFIKPVNSIRRH